LGLLALIDTVNVYFFIELEGEIKHFDVIQDFFPLALPGDQGALNEDVDDVEAAHTCEVHCQGPVDRGHEFIQLLVPIIKFLDLAYMFSTMSDFPLDWEPYV
jgi:hypothetical protein